MSDHTAHRGPEPPSRRPEQGPGASRQDQFTLRQEGSVPESATHAVALFQIASFREQRVDRAGPGWVCMRAVGDQE